MVDCMYQAAISEGALDAFVSIFTGSPVRSKFFKVHMVIMP